jgi:prepilin-type N-terminal cleavage/methylation domain-containing protein
VSVQPDAMMRRLRLLVRDDRGFTLIEMMVSIAVLGIFFAAFATVVGSAIRHSSEIQEQSVLQTEVRASVDSLVADLRQTSIAGDTTLSRISTATGTQLTFLSPDRQPLMHLRRISYQVTGGQLQRAIATSTNTTDPWAIPALSAWSTVARSIATTSIPVFTYFDVNGASTSVPANINTVRIRVTVATATTPGRQFTYDTRVALRPES